MDREQRLKVIIRAVDRPGVTTVDSLVSLTGASGVTIRRDLAELEAIGAVERVHGGAKKVATRGAPQPFSLRQSEDKAEKQALAIAVAEMINDEESVIIDNGTTCQAVARRLSGRPITALCLSLYSAAAIAKRPGARVIIPGGEVENDTLALHGSAALSTIHDFSADVILLGSCSTSLERGLATVTYPDAENKRAGMAAASRSILVVTPRKLGRVSTFRFADVSDLDTLVTTADAPREMLAEIRDLGVRVVTV